MESNHSDHPHFSLEPCDESKCVSKGRSELFGGSFTCYGDDNGEFYPRMCSDGYIPTVVNDGPIVFASTWHIQGFFVEKDENGQVPVRYFTCCPPRGAISATRHCSDPIIDDGSDCKDKGNQRYSVSMKTQDDSPESHLCCDSENKHNGTEIFLEETECVPYRNELYEPCLTQKNQIGRTFAFTCNDPGGDFVFPRPLGNETFDNLLSNKQYQCCRMGPSLPPYVQDSTFWFTVCTELLLNTLSVLAAAVVVVGLSVPLLTKLKSTTNQNSLTSSARSRRNPGSGPPYSTYNLYLIYLAIPDLVLNLYFLIEIPMKQASQQISNRSILVELIGATTVANVWLNTIILHQVLVLLQNAHDARRVQPPSLKRVTLQAGAVCCLAVLNGLQTYYTEPFNGGIKGLVSLAVGLLTTTIPIGYGIYVGILVHRRGYLRTENGSVATRAVKEVAIYFFRIVWIFIGVWIPALVLLATGFFLGQAWSAWMSLLLIPIQTIVSTCVILTKSDVRKYVSDLLSLYGLCGSFFSMEKKLGESSKTANTHMEPNIAANSQKESKDMSNKNDVEATEGGHCHPTVRERQLGQRLVVSTIDSEEIVFGTTTTEIETNQDQNEPTNPSLALPKSQQGTKNNDMIGSHFFPNPQFQQDV